MAELQAQLQQLVDALQQAQQAPAAQQPVYALTPAQLNANDFIDYSTTDGKKIFKAATEELSYQFDVQAKSVNLFGETLYDRGVISGWNEGQGNIMSIPDSNNVTRNLIREYGRLTLDNIRTFVTTYIGQQNRRAQNDYQLYMCLANSLTESGKLKVLAETDQYTINGTPSGSLFFKLLMQKAIVDTRATASHLRENLTNLDTYITTIDSNIQLFNQYVKVNREGLRARGESTDDLMINLFKGYMNAADRDFVEYIKLKKDQYDEGGEIDAEQLMTLALNKYENLLTENKWKALSPEQEQLVALSAQFDKLKDENLRLSKAIKSNKKPKGNENKSQSSKKKKSKGKANDTKWAWKKVPPKEGERKTKVLNDRTYHWCETHLAWGEHTNEECKLRMKLEQDEDKSKKKSSSDTKASSKRTSFAQAMSTILEEMDEE